MHTFRKVAVAAIAAIMLVLVAAPAGAQDAPPVLIYPVDRAEFLPGALFDLQVEVHTEELPEDFAVTINGTPAGEFFGVESETLSWTFGDEEAPTPSQAPTWRAITFDEPGEYTVEVTAGGNTTSAAWNVRDVDNEGAKNIVLFIADGANIATYTAARLMSRGMQQGFYNDRLSFETFEEIGQLSTSGTDSIMTDSANSASSYNTGHKTAVNATGVYANTSRGEFEQQFDDAWVETFAEMIARTRGMSSGVISTRYIGDATPAAVWGHSRERNNAARADFSLQALGMGMTGARGDWPTADMAVMMGGGARFFLPASIPGSSRGDELAVFDMYDEAGYAVVQNATELAAAMESNPERLLGTFNIGEYSYWLDRNVYTDNVADFPDQPGLVDMTMAALDVMSQNENGFYLMVEAGAVDRAFHPLDFDRGLADTIEFDRAIAATVDYLAENGMSEDTLIVVTSDHAHSFDVFGVVDVEAFNAAAGDPVGQRDAIGLYGGAGFPTYVDEDGDFYPDSWTPSRTLAMGKVEAPPFTEDYQVSEVPRSPATRDDNGNVVNNPDDDPDGYPVGGEINSTSSVHTLQDVPIYAQGPGSEFFGRSLENYEVFFGMANAIGIDPRAEDGMAAMMDAGSDSDGSALANTGLVSTNTGLISGILMLIVGLGAGMFIQGVAMRRRES